MHFCYWMPHRTTYFKQQNKSIVSLSDLVIYSDTIKIVMYSLKFEMVISSYYINYEGRFTESRLRLYFKFEEDILTETFCKKECFIGRCIILQT